MRLRRRSFERQLREREAQLRAAASTFGLADDPPDEAQVPEPRLAAVRWIEGENVNGHAEHRPATLVERYAWPERYTCEFCGRAFPSYPRLLTHKCWDSG